MLGLCSHRQPYKCPDHQRENRYNETACFPRIQKTPGVVIFVRII